MRLEVTARHFVDKVSAPRQREQGDALLDGAARDDEEVFAVRGGEPPVAFSDIGRNRQRSPVQLIDQETVAPGKMLSTRAHLVSKVDRPLIDLQLLKTETHRQPLPLGERVDRRTQKVDGRREEKVTTGSRSDLLSTFSSLLLY